VECGAPIARKNLQYCKSCYLKIRTPVEERIWRRIVWNGDEDECWTWEGATTSMGYGHVNAGPGAPNVLVHRLMHELFIGPIPDDLEVDHLCHNADKGCAGGTRCLHRRCVNPAHLEAVTQSVNAKRGRTGEHSNGR
jgi:hypothetical protein